METTTRVGRPRASSRETLAEAACELFLEQGFAATSIVDITRRAGVSRSSFFNYFSSKSDILWGGFDERLDLLMRALRDGQEIDDALRDFADGFAPDSLALGIAHGAVMGIEADLENERARRQLRLGMLIADRLREEGDATAGPDIDGAARAAALFTAIWRWAESGPGAAPLRDDVSAAVDLVLPRPPRPTA
ncbi:TetR/AcrR family transcriptional regulator [Microbacterium xanthum]|uniref:TetR/AcrR family transcriptional regulator n=1 Tax=Microbacterium xanthum TaxID=3079794 RepID=UPI002AD2D926|nr:TetR/AcrR family transcriptional regulator [Microbacterium sp. KSW-48]MDZ8172320.1 TetR/AcrR family transcriptional regulator [Microbacterium sp. KSW-48]